MKDRIFTQEPKKQFEFDEQVASVFDDMLERSIPHYREVLGLIVDFCLLHISEIREQNPSTQNLNLESPASVQNQAAQREKPQEPHLHALDSSQNAQDSLLIYDLGSSTGSTLLALHQALLQQDSSSQYAKVLQSQQPESQRDCPQLQHKQPQLIGIDNSNAMIEKARLKARAYDADIAFICADLLEYEFSPCSIVLANYILQFIRPMQRQNLLQKIYDSLQKGGIFIMSEKMSCPHRILDRQMIERYLRYKREQGYTQSEISKKREALENVLIPFSLEENLTLLKNVGFECVEVLFKWVNFGTIIAKK